MILEKDALQTAPATFPFAIDVNAIEDCTVEGKKHINKKPQYNCCPRSGSKTGLAKSPITGKITKVKAKKENESEPKKKVKVSVKNLN